MFYFNQNPIIISIFYVICVFITTMTYQSIIISLSTISILILAYIIHLVLRRKLNVPLLLAYMILSQILNLYNF